MSLPGALPNLPGERLGTQEGTHLPLVLCSTASQLKTSLPNTVHLPLWENDPSRSSLPSLDVP